MKAAQISEYGDASVVKINDISKPFAGEGRVVVEVYAASINPYDSMVRSGKVKDTVPLDLPVTLGGDIAGVVSEVGAGVTQFKVGDKVFGQASAVAGNSGAFAEFAATSAGQIALAPTSIDFQKAASLPLVGVSALQVVAGHLNVQPGQKLFIHGGAGGIGSLAIQIAKHLGAYVATTATGGGLEFVRHLGADQVIDYKQQKFSDVLHDFDAVFDAVGGEDFSLALGVLKRGGKAVSMTQPPDEARAAELGVTALMQHTKVATDDLVKLAALVDEGAITPQVDIVFPLSQTAEAFRQWESGAVRGKVVLAVKG